MSTSRLIEQLGQLLTRCQRVRYIETEEQPGEEVKKREREGKTNIEEAVDVTRMGLTAFQTSGAIQKGVPTNVDLSDA